MITNSGQDGVAVDDVVVTVHEVMDPLTTDSSSTSDQSSSTSFSIVAMIFVLVMVCLLSG
jgi:hypothetical protein